MVSPSSKTEWIIRRSPDSMTADASARSTSSRSSVSVENGPSLKPLPGVIALPSRISSAGMRAEDRGDQRERCRPTAARCGRRSGRPTVRGATPIRRTTRRSMTPMVVSTLGTRRVVVGVARPGADQHDGADLAQQPQQQRGVEVAGGSSRIITRRVRAGAALCLGSSSARAAGEPVERRVGGGEQAGEQDQDGSRAELPDVCGHRQAVTSGGLGHRAPLSSSSPCSPNITACSSGSAWS